MSQSNISLAAMRERSAMRKELLKQTLGIKDGTSLSEALGNVSTKSNHQTDKTPKSSKLGSCGKPVKTVRGIQGSGFSESGNSNKSSSDTESKRRPNLRGIKTERITDRKRSRTSSREKSPNISNVSRGYGYIKSSNACMVVKGANAELI